MDYISRDDFLSALVGTEQTIQVGGMTISVRPLTLIEREAIRTATTGADGQLSTIDMEVETVLAGMANPKLNRADIEALKTGRAGIIDEIAQSIMQISGMGDDAEKKAGDGS